MHLGQGNSNAAASLKLQILTIMQLMSIMLFILYFFMYLSKYKACFNVSVVSYVGVLTPRIFNKVAENKNQNSFYFFYSKTNVFTTMV